MPSLRDEAHDGWLYKLCITAAVNSISSQLGGSCPRPGKRGTDGTEKAGGTARPSHLTFLRPARRAAVLDQPSSLRSQLFYLYISSPPPPITLFDAFWVQTARQSYTLNHQREVEINGLGTKKGECVYALIDLVSDPEKCQELSPQSINI